MKSIEKNISPLIENQFPDFFKEQGPLFILFVEEYYKWLESNDSEYAGYAQAILTGNPTYHTRRLFDYKDVDKTADEFLVYLKEKYLKNVTFDTAVSKRKLIKASHDLFKSKGSQRSLELFFKLLYNTKIEIYSPGDDILKPSSGQWVVPVYLELTRSPKNVTYVGKQVTGSLSGATAFVQYLITRNFKNNIQDIAFITDLRGTFIKGEIIYDSTGVDNAPKLLGSLNGLSITTGGQLFEVGEVVDIISSFGVEGKARVTNVSDVSGLISFTIVDGGWGYSNTSEIIIGNTLRVSNVNNTNSEITSFFVDEVVVQNLYNFSLTDTTGTFSNNFYIINANTTDTPLSLSVSAINTLNTSNIVSNQLVGNIFSNSIIIESNTALVTTNSSIEFVAGDAVIQRTGSSNNIIGVILSSSNVTVLTVNTSTISSNGIHTGNYVEQTGSGAYGFISGFPREDYFDFTNISKVVIRSVQGTFNNTSSVSMYTSNNKVTNLGSFDPTNAATGYQYRILSDSSSSNTRWSTSNTIIKIADPSVNGSILVSTDVAGILTSSSNVSAQGIIYAQNASTIGIYTASGTFYAGDSKGKIRGTDSNTSANLEQVYTGSGATFVVGNISDTETITINSDFISSNNDGPGLSSVKFYEMLLTGANSTFGVINNVLILDGGTGYDNTNIAVFVGGNSGSGSYEAGNASILTDSSGTITEITLGANTGNGIITTPTISIVNSTGGSTGVGSNADVIPLSPLGFEKLPIGSLDNRIIELLTFTDKTIGTITSLAQVNPGENYNISPFVRVLEREVAAFDKRDILLNISNSSGTFIIGENVSQSINTPAALITSNNYSGNNNFDYQEIIYSTDGISNSATGIVFSSDLDVVTNTITTVIVSNTGTWQNTINVSILTVLSNTNFEPGNLIEQSTSANGILVTSNTTTLIVKNVVGTFTTGTVTSNAFPTPGSTTISSEANSTIFRAIGLSSNLTSDIISTSACTSSSFASGTVVLESNTSLTLKRKSLFTEFLVGGVITGSFSGTTANVNFVSIVEDSFAAGDNANVVANVVTSAGSITNVSILSSGYAYADSENVTLLSQDGLRSASAQANVKTQGIGEGRYRDRNGFLDDNKYLHDGEYYQNYSYVINSEVPLEKYRDILKDVLHIAGKKFFGGVYITPVANISLSGSTSIIVE